MATVNAVSIAYRGVLSAGCFPTIASAAGAGWEDVTDAGALLPEIPGAVAAQGQLEFFRVLVPYEKGEQVPAGLDLRAAYTGAAGAERWSNPVGGPNVPVMQMLAGDTDPHVFWIEYGRMHSVPR
jgi:hypothetical protein